MMAVADCVPVADLDDGDRRQHRRTVLGEPRALPPRASRRGGSEVVAELRGSAGLDGTADRIERDLADTRAGTPSGPSGRAFVVDGKTTASRAPTTQTADQQGAPARSGGAVEGPFCLDPPKSGFPGDLRALDRDAQSSGPIMRHEPRRYGFAAPYRARSEPRALARGGQRSAMAISSRASVCSGSVTSGDPSGSATGRVCSKSCQTSRLSSASRRSRRSRS
jgi:hypothetical protein